MKEMLEKIREQAEKQIAIASTPEALDEIRVSVLGKKGELTQILKGMKDVSPEERPKVGQMVNAVRDVLEEALTEQKKNLKSKVIEMKMETEWLDVTRPGTRTLRGHKHPNQIALEDLERVFIGMGYEVVEGPEVEYDRMNFKLLNIPEDHPAKDEQDTFYIQRHDESKGETTEDDIVLRTQTSSVQARVMLAAGKFKETSKGFPERTLPIKLISPGRVFRSDEVDATHSPSFHQVEGLVIGENVTMADLKGTLDQFAKEFFGPDTKTKLRPHHFPFTEPSAEVDVTCFKCHGTGRVKKMEEVKEGGKLVRREVDCACTACKSSGWIEILGCGMVHPDVLEMCGINDSSNPDAPVYTGFAFGIGLERVALLKYEIADMRLLYENDIRFLEQF